MNPSVLITMPGKLSVSGTPSISFTPTDNAMSLLAPIFQVFHVSIRFIKWMALRASYFTSIHGPWRKSTTEIFNESYGLHMLRIYTTPDAAKVVDLKSFWYRLYKVFVGPAMDESFLPSYIKQTIPMITNIAQPQPAPRVGLRGYGIKKSNFRTWTRVLSAIRHVFLRGSSERLVPGNTSEWCFRLRGLAGTRIIVA